MLCALAAAAAALAGEPECSTNLYPCLYDRTRDMRFVDAFIDYFKAIDGAQDPTGVANSDLLCHGAAWSGALGCLSSCPYRLRVVEPADLAGLYCLEDNAFEPFSPDGHMDMQHPLNGVVKDVVTTPPANRAGCSEDDFRTAGAEGRYTDKIVLLQRGGCYFVTKFANAQAQGAAAGAMINIYPTDALTSLITVMIGEWHEPVVIPGAMMSRHDGSALLEALDAGRRVRGAFELDCGAGAGAGAGLLADNGCPGAAVADICGALHQDAAARTPRDALCVACRTQASLGPPGAPGAAAGLCVHGNTLYPPSPHTTIWNEPGTVPSPHAPKKAVVVTALAALPGGGCALSDYAPLAGAFAAVPTPSGCVHFEAVRLAQAAGVTGVLFWRDAGDTDFLPVGKSSLVTIPVHVMPASSAAALLAAAAAYGTPYGGRAGMWEVTAHLQFTGPHGAASLPPAVPAPQEVVAAPVELISQGFAASPTVVACAVLIVLGLAGLVGLLVKLHPGQRARGGAAEAGENKIPLGVASMLLSVTLLVAVTSVAFGLAVAAGADAAATASADGNAAVAYASGKALENVGDLASKLRSAVVSRVELGVSSVEASAEQYALAIAGLYTGLDDGAWPTFYKYWRDFELLSRAARPNWQANVRTTAGYFASNTMLTDFNPPALRRGGELFEPNHTVAETHNGSLYGLQILWWVAGPRTNVEWYATALFTDEATVEEVLGSELGDPLAFTGALMAGDVQWHISRYSWNSALKDTQPDLRLSCFTPVYNRKYEYMGSVEAVIEASDFRSILDGALSGEAYFANASVLLFMNAPDRALIAMSAYSERSYPYVLRSNAVAVWATYKLYSLGEVPHVHATSLNRLLEERAGDLAAAGALAATYDPAEYHTYPQYVVTDAYFADGVWQDSSAQRWGTKQTGRRVFDAALGHDAAELDGGDDVILLLRELTVDSQTVAQTRVATPDGSFASDSPFFQDGTRVLEDGRECVLCPVHIGPPPNYTSYVCQLRPMLWDDDFTITLAVKPAVEYPLARAASTPRLFSNSRVGAYDIRIFANGEMATSLTDVACQTPPFKAPLPAHQWSIITAVMNDQTKECFMYVNGTLAGHGYKSTNTEVMQLSEPFVMGLMFQGRYGRVALHSVPMSAAEIQDVAAQALARPAEPLVYRQQVRSQRMYVDVKHSGGKIPLTIAAMMPIDDVLRNVQEKTKSTSRNLRVQEENTKTKLAQVTYEAVFVVVVVMLVAVALFLLFNHALTRPFSDIAVVMTNAAMMRVDEIPESTSRLTELYTMNRAMAIMVQNLREYRAYIPQSLLQTLGPKDDDCGDSFEVDIVIVFTDIKSSTSLWDRCGQAMAAGLRIHNNIIRAHIADFDGYEVKTIGDAFMVAFQSVDAAVAFSVKVQESLHEADWPAELLEHEAAEKSACGAWNGIKIRIGVNVGRAEMSRDAGGRIDYFGHAVNVAARVEGQCIPGAVCCTTAVMDELCNEDAGDPVVVPMGKRELKGVDVEADLTLLVPRDNAARVDAVTQQLKTHVGKEADNDDLEAMLRRRPSEDAMSAMSGYVAQSAYSDSRDGMSYGSNRSGSCSYRVKRRQSTLKIARTACQEQLDRKRCIVAKTAFRWETGDLMEARDPLTLTKSALDVLSQAAQRTGGHVHFVFGSAALVSWQHTGAMEHTKQAFAFVGHTTALLGRAGACRFSSGLAAGHVLAGNVGTANQRFTTLLGSVCTLAELLCESCAALETAALYAGVKDAPALKYPRLKRAMRPVDVWRVDTSTLTVYEVHQDGLKKPGQQQPCKNPLDAPQEPEVSEQAPAEASTWGGEYWHAYKAGELHALGEFPDDPVYLQVRALQAAGGALRPPVPRAVLAVRARSNADAREPEPNERLQRLVQRVSIQRHSVEAMRSMSVSSAASKEEKE